MSTLAENCALEPSLPERGAARGAGRLGGGAAVQRRQGATEASSSCVGVVDGPEKGAAKGAKERRVKDLRCPGLFTRPTPRAPEGGAQAPGGGRRGAPGVRPVAVVDGVLGRRAGQRPRIGVGCPAPWPTWSHDVGVQATRTRWCPCRRRPGPQAGAMERAHPARGDAPRRALRRADGARAPCPGRGEGLGGVGKGQPQILGFEVTFCPVVSTQ